MRWSNAHSPTCWLEQPRSSNHDLYCTFVMKNFDFELENRNTSHLRPLLKFTLLQTIGQIASFCYFEIVSNTGFVLSV